jgi:RNA:NAD 2'-phosphotransferase (TPT1/KptA family)
MTAAISKQLSYVLRHRPDAIGISLDRAGWVAVDERSTGAARVADRRAQDVRRGTPGMLG